MAYNEFFEGKLVNVFNSNETVLLGQFQPANNQELGHIRSELFIHGDFSSNERLRIKIGLTDDDTAPYAISDWVLIKDFDISDATKDWIGWVRFDFGRENINENETYYIWIESDNYTRVGDTKYVSVVFDYPYPVYANDVTHTNSTWAFQWFGYF